MLIDKTVNTLIPFTVCPLFQFVHGFCTAGVDRGAHEACVTRSLLRKRKYYDDIYIYET